MHWQIRAPRHTSGPRQSIARLPSDDEHPSANQILHIDDEISSTSAQSRVKVLIAYPKPYSKVKTSRIVEVCVGIDGFRP